MLDAGYSDVAVLDNTQHVHADDAISAPTSRTRAKGFLAHCFMEFAYLHVVINHLPIMGVPVVFGIFLFGLWTRQPSVQHAALLAFVVLGPLTVVVYLTGQAGEDFAEHAPGLLAGAIDDHEDAASLGLASVGALSLACLYLFVRQGGIALLRRRSHPPSVGLPTLAAGLVIVLALGATAVLGYTGRLGGKISHTEFAERGGSGDDGSRDDRRGRGRGRGGRD